MKNDDKFDDEDNDEFDDKNVFFQFYHDDNNLIDEKSFVDDNDINIEFKLMTKKKFKSSQRKENFENKIKRMLIRELLNQLSEKIFRKMIVRRYKILFGQMMKPDNLLLKNDRKTF